MTFFKFSVPLLVAVSVIAGPASAQQTGQATTPPAPPPPFCENNDGFNDWDFWVGNWNVYSNDENRNFQGTNSIEKKYNNCLMTETWMGASGGGGFSINYYNAVTGEWRQVWIANGFSIDYTGGLNEDGQMVLNGFIYGYRPNKQTPFRGIWTAEDNGDVIQHFDIYDAANDVWNVWFEGRYVRQETDPNPPEGK